MRSNALFCVRGAKTVVRAPLPTCCSRAAAAVRASSALNLTSLSSSWAAVSWPCSTSISGRRPYQMRVLFKGFARLYGGDRASQGGIKVATANA
jgi:hypothetical protein